MTKISGHYDASRSIYSREVLSTLTNGKVRIQQSDSSSSTPDRYLRYEGSRLVEVTEVPHKASPDDPRRIVWTNVYGPEGLWRGRTAEVGKARFRPLKVEYIFRDPSEPELD